MPMIIASASYITDTPLPPGYNKIHYSEYTHFPTNSQIRVSSFHLFLMEYLPISSTHNYHTNL